MEKFQDRVKAWITACMGAAYANDKRERNHRFLEEALELVQANGCTEDEARQLVAYVFARPKGEIRQEIGGALTTLNALCAALDIDLVDAGETELARCWERIEQIRAKCLAKPAFSPLPGTYPNEPGVRSKG